MDCIRIFCQNLTFEWSWDYCNSRRCPIIDFRNFTIETLNDFGWNFPVRPKCWWAYLGYEKSTCKTRSSHDQRISAGIFTTVKQRSKKIYRESKYRKETRAYWDWGSRANPKYHSKVPIKLFHRVCQVKRLASSRKRLQGLWYWKINHGAEPNRWWKYKTHSLRQRNNAAGVHLSWLNHFYLVNY